MKSQSPKHVNTLLFYGLFIYLPILIIIHYKNLLFAIYCIFILLDSGEFLNALFALAIIAYLGWLFSILLLQGYSLIKTKCQISHSDQHSLLLRFWTNGIFFYPLTYFLLKSWEEAWSGSSVEFDFFMIPMVLCLFAWWNEGKLMGRNVF